MRVFFQNSRDRRARCERREALRELSRAAAGVQADLPDLVRSPSTYRRPGASRWGRSGDAFVCESWTPDLVEERNERLAWMVGHRRPFLLTMGQIVPRSARDEGIADALEEAMLRGRGEWKSKLRELGLAGVPQAAEGTYGALGAYPLPGELASVTPTATEASLITTANLALYMPLPANGILGPQAYRFVVAGRTTTTATAANYTWTPRLGNANTSPSLGASAALAKTISITNAIFVMKGDITIQSIGVAGANSKAFGHFSMDLNTAAGGATQAWHWGSTAAASFDSTVSGSGSANGGIVWIGATASAAAADPFTIGAIHFMDWN